MTEKRDLRVIKTEKALVDAMVQSLQTKKFEEITVQSICEMSMVRRATFYTHFADKYELFAFTIRRVYQEFPSFQQATSPNRTTDVYQQMIEDAVNFLAAHVSIFNSLVNSQMMPLVMNIILTEIHQDILPVVEADMQAHHVEGQTPQLVITYHLHGIFGSFLWWIREGYPISKEELILQIGKLLNI